MNFSFSAIYMTILSTNLMIMVLAICFHNFKAIVSIGYKLLALFALFSFLRIILPVEMFFTKLHQLPKWLSSGLVFFRHARFEIFGYPVSIWTLLSIVWIIGSIYRLIQYLRENARARYYILSNGYSVTDQEPYHTLLEKICKQKHRRNRFEILQLDELSTPIAYGLFKPYILIPTYLKLSDEEWYYVLGHEASHHFHLDLFTKAFIDLMNIVYWWNPFCHRLSEQCDMVLEMRIDRSITSSEFETKRSYSECLLAVADQIADHACMNPPDSMPFIPGTGNALALRVNMLIPLEGKRNYLFNIAMTVFFLGIFVLSYSHTFEAYYIREDVVTESMITSTDGAYAVLLEDGTYDLYYGDFYLENVTSLEYYPSDMPVFDQPITNEDIPSLP